MKNILKYTLYLVLFIGISSFTLKSDAANKQYKVLVQMKNYSGEGAYIVVSVINDKNQYVKTLQLIGDDKQWFNTLKSWWAFHAKRKLSDIDAISGATVSGGERSTFTLNISEAWMNKGYKLRFETAVEEVNYYTSDVEIPLTTAGLSTRPEGKGFIRYVRLMPTR
ncbi:MAG: DUF2271 domain-containing protein [Weeksellaceae bacterium]|nr:DUF2271 domain-containing protein [Weeksellaceae bacterium]